MHERMSPEVDENLHTDDLIGSTLENVNQDTVNGRFFQSAPREKATIEQLKENLQKEEKLWQVVDLVRRAGLRGKHIRFLKGEYTPSQRELAFFAADKKFYESSIYRVYRQQEVLKFAEKNRELYDVKTKEVLPRLVPYLERIQQNILRLMNIATVENWQDEEGDMIVNLAEFFTEMFDINQMPMLQYLDKSSADYGNYDEQRNIISYKNFKKRTLKWLVELVNTLAHEFWHAHQSQTNKKEYIDNNRNYILQETDFDAYKRQLIEKEAFIIGDGAAYIFRMAYLKMHPKLQADLANKYLQWDNEYKIEDEYPQLDALWLCAANDNRRQRFEIADWSDYAY